MSVVESACFGRTSMRLPIRIALALIAAVVVWGCAKTTSSVAARAIERALPKIVGPAQSYHVTIEGLRGTSYAETVTATGKRVHPKGSPVLDTVDIELKDVSYDPNRGELEKVGSATATITVLAGDIANYLNSTGKVRDASVTLDAPDRAEVQAQVEIPGLPVSANAVVTATGNLTSGDNYINFDVAQVTAGGVVLPDAAVDVLSQAINPIVDLSSMPIAVRATGVHVENGDAVIQIAGEYPPPSGTVSSQQ
jgi:hypothetical protein